MVVNSIGNYILTPHAVTEARRRGIREAIIDEVLHAPEQRASVRTGRDVLQRRLNFAGRTYLVRVFVDVDRTPAEVVTVYRTSKIGKYWR